MNYSESIKQRIIKNIKNDNRYNGLYKTFESSIVFNDIEDNFCKSSYENIKSHPSWYDRTKKLHSHFNDGTLEMQSSNSSDALLMNIFCHPKFNTWKGVNNYLGINSDDEKIFGWNPFFDNENPQYPTEVDLKIGNHIFESKLTENTFTSKDVAIIENYTDFSSVFDSSLLEKDDNKYKHYQLIRNVLAAYKYDFYFSIIIDSSRIDLINELLNVVIAVKDSTLRKRINFFTWQEIVDLCGKEIKEYIGEKYF